MSRHLLPAVACLLIAASLSGCIGEGAPSDLPVASFEEAMDADGEVVEPVDAGSSVRLKLLDPADPSGIPTGKRDIVVVLFDDGPITDAEMTLEAWMPSMGHGTSPEEDPVHREDGIYVGRTNLVMLGDWILNVTATLGSGETLQYEIDVAVGGDGGGEGGSGTTFGSFQAAMDAEGETFAADEGWVTDETEDSGRFVAAVPAEEVQSNTHGFDVPETDSALVTVSASLAPGTNADELTFSIRDPDGQEQESMTLTAAEQESGNVSFETGSSGNWSIVVTGQAVDTTYSLTMAVGLPVGQDIRLKMLDPSSPDQAEQGKQPLVLLLYDEAAGEPVTDASMSLRSYMPSMGHGTDGEEDPTHQGDGIYEGMTNFAMGGEWQMNVTAELSNGGVLDWSITVPVSG